MTKASKARKAFVASDDVVVSNVTYRVDASIARSTALALLPVAKPSEQPEGPTQINDTFLAKYRVAIRSKFNAGAKFVDLIGTLNLTADDKDAIEKLRVVFYDTWLECIFERRGLSSTQARKYHEDLMETKRAAWSDEDKRAYGATKTAWVDVRERAGLKAAPTSNSVNKGQGKNKNEGDGEKKPIDLSTFDNIHQEVIDIAQYLDAICKQGAKVKTAGLLQHVADCARALRVAAHASKLEMDADKATK